MWLWKRNGPSKLLLVQWLLVILFSSLPGDALVETFYIPIQKIHLGVFTKTIGFLELRVPDISDDPREVYINSSGKKIDTLKIIPSFRREGNAFFPEKTLSLIQMFPINGFDRFGLQSGYFPIIRKYGKYLLVVYDPVTFRSTWIDIHLLKEDLEFPIGYENYGPKEYYLNESFQCAIPVNLYILLEQDTRIFYREPSDTSKKFSVPIKDFQKKYSGYPFITKIKGCFGYIRIFPYEDMGEEETPKINLGWVKIHNHNNRLTVWPSMTFHELTSPRYIRNWFIASFANAIRRNDHATVLSILTDGFNPNQRIYDEEFSAYPLNLASKSNSLTICRYLIHCGASVITVDMHKNTPLMEAVNNGSFPIVKLLINNGSQVNRLNTYRQSVLNLACYPRNLSIPIINFLIRSGAEVNNINIYKNSPLTEVCLNGNVEVAEMLIKAGAAINYKNQNRRTPLCIAVEKGNEELVDLLIQSGSDLEARDMLNQTPFLVAVRKGYLSIVKKLKNAGANIFAKDENGNSALDLAEEYDREMVIDYLQPLYHRKTDRIHSLVR